MDAGQVVTVARQTIWVIVKTSVPLLLVSMIVGLIISLFQTLTSRHLHLFQNFLQL